MKKRDAIPTAKQTFNLRFPDISPANWIQIYLLPRKVTNDAYGRVFQYKVLNNVLYLNKKLFLSALSETSYSTFCNAENEDTSHLFYDCPQTRGLWLALKNVFDTILPLPDLTTKHALLGFFDHDRENCMIVNHILLIFKIFIYRQRGSGILSIDNLLTKIKDIAILEINVANFDPQNNDWYLQKWRPIFPIIFFSNFTWLKSREMLKKIILVQLYRNCMQTNVIMH